MSIYKVRFNIDYDDNADKIQIFHVDERLSWRLMISKELRSIQYQD